MFDFAWPDALGIAGVTVILVAYAATQAGKVAVRDVRYSLANAIGALAILISLYYSFNLASFVIEIFWLLISLYGLWRALADRPHEEEE